MPFLAASICSFGSHRSPSNISYSLEASRSKDRRRELGKDASGAVKNYLRKARSITPSCPFKWFTLPGGPFIILRFQKNWSHSCTRVEVKVEWENVNPRNSRLFSIVGSYLVHEPDLASLPHTSTSFERSQSRKSNFATWPDPAVAPYRAERCCVMEGKNCIDNSEFWILLLEQQINFSLSHLPRLVLLPTS